MAPRKSDAMKVATGDEATAVKEGKEGKDGVNIEDLNLPKSIVTRLAKGVLPPNTQIQSNAMLALSKSATVFVNYLATHANEIAQGHNRKTVTPADVFKTLEELQFGEFKPRLEAELQKFSEVQTDKRNTYRKKIAADKAAGISGAGDTSMNESGEGVLGEKGQPVAKKARRDTLGNESVGMSDMPDDDTRGEGEEHDEDEVGIGEGEGMVDDDETEDDENADVEDRDIEVEVEDSDLTEGEDEALDNGQDSE